MFVGLRRRGNPELTEQIEGRLLWEEGHRPEADAPSVNPQTGLQEFFGPENETNLLTPEGRFEAWRKLGEKFGTDFAVENLNHFRGATGKDKWIDPGRLLKYPRIQKSTEDNLTRFAEKTFTNWDPETDRAKEMLSRLDALKDGETVNIVDSWDSNFGSVLKPEKRALAPRGFVDSLSAGAYHLTDGTVGFAGVPTSQERLEEPRLTLWVIFKLAARGTN